MYPLYIPSCCFSYTYPLPFNFPRPISFLCSCICHGTKVVNLARFFPQRIISSSFVVPRFLSGVVSVISLYCHHLNLPTGVPIGKHKINTDRMIYPSFFAYYPSDASKLQTNAFATPCSTSVYRRQCGSPPMFKI